MVDLPMNLPDPATSSHEHLVADWVELAAMANRDGLVSGEVLVAAREEADDRRNRRSSPTKVDARQREAEDVWNVLRGRSAFYGDSYPFAVADDTLGIQTTQINNQSLIYAFLLAASNLAAFDGSERQLLTAAFERTSRHTLAALLPPGSTVSIFGTSSSPSERYGQARLIDRLQALATDLHTRLTIEGEREGNNGKPRSSGDGGLDLVGWPELAGPRKRLPVYFGQCACGSDWHSKPYEVLEVTWSNRLEVVSPIVPVTFIPYAYRTVDNQWPDLFRVVPTVLIDRPRWLKLLNESRSIDEAIADVPTEWLLQSLPGLRAEEPQLRLPTA